MVHCMASGHRKQSVGEEIANSVSHGLGFLGAVAALPVLILAAVDQGPAAVTGVSIFAGTMAFLYLMSTLYHALGHARTKHVFQILDHGAIYLLIAGTYTPILLGVLHGPWGWTLLAVIWSLAIGGVIIKSVGGVRHPRLSTALYVAMGWLIVVAAWPMWLNMPRWGLAWLIAGGLFYMAGVMFYSRDRMRYNHFIWHLFVLAGTGCHFVAIWRFALAGRVSGQ
jgi:hemolysin III